MSNTNSIKTNIKFYKGLDNAMDRLYGFVTKKNGNWRGCRIDEAKKKIVFVDPSIASDIVPNVLYHCSLIPMQCNTGFIAKTAKLVMFEANIIADCNEDFTSFSVKVKYGNKELVYDPGSREKRKRDIQGIARIIRLSIELKNAMIVAEDFINCAVEVKTLYNKYKKNV